MGDEEPSYDRSRCATALGTGRLAGRDWCAKVPHSVLLRLTSTARCSVAFSCVVQFQGSELFHSCQKATLRKCFSEISRILPLPEPASRCCPAGDTECTRRGAPTPCDPETEECEEDSALAVPRAHRRESVWGR